MPPRSRTSAPSALLATDARSGPRRTTCPQLSDFDEHFVHQIPEPLGVVGIEHHALAGELLLRHPWPRVDSDVVVVAMATYPPRHLLDALVLGRVGGELVFRPLPTPRRRRSPHLDRGPGVGGGRRALSAPARGGRLRRRLRRRAHLRGAHRRLRAAAGSASRRLGRAAVGPEPHDPVGHLRRHLQQQSEPAGPSMAGWANGTTPGGCATTAASRCGPGWRSSFPTGCSGSGTGSCADGARVFTDGCWAPAGGGAPVPVVDFRHDLHWTDDAGPPSAYGPDGSAVSGLTGHGRLRPGRRLAR